jgi:hypothetical protein
MGKSPSQLRRTPVRTPPGLAPEPVPQSILAAIRSGHPAAAHAFDPPSHMLRDAAQGLPSEEVEPDPEPTFGAPGERVSLHEPSEASLLATGFDGESADDPAELPEPAIVAKVRAPGARKPMGSREQRMAWPPEEGFFHYWFNDEPGRIQRATQAGYTHVDFQGKHVSTIVGVDRAGKPLLAFLMKLPKEWRDEDQQAIADEQDAILGAIRRGKMRTAGMNPRDQGTVYVPSQGISISSGRR